MRRHQLIARTAIAEQSQARPRNTSISCRIFGLSGLAYFPSCVESEDRSIRSTPRAPSLTTYSPSPTTYLPAIAGYLLTVADYILTGSCRLPTHRRRLSTHRLLPATYSPTHYSSLTNYPPAPSHRTLREQPPLAASYATRTTFEKE